MALRHPPPASTPATRAVMRANPSKNTSPELHARRLLREAGFPGYRVHWKNAPGTPDIAYPGRRVAIFINGCYWHRCPTCYPTLPKSNQDFWAQKFHDNEVRDRRSAESLSAMGWRRYVVWECQLKKTPAEALDEVLSTLRSSSQSAL
jgi:DNA mismatch endonuclease (patch repair protein)